MLLSQMMGFRGTVTYRIQDTQKLSQNEFNKALLNGIEQCLRIRKFVRKERLGHSWSFEAKVSRF